MKTNITAPATETAILPIQTKHLAVKFNLKPTALRRILRSMKEYADGVHTNYRWAENDPRIAQIAAQIAQLNKAKTDRAAAAKLALEQRIAATNKQQQVDAKAGLAHA